jgi:hypothetical protein
MSVLSVPRAARPIGPFKFPPRPIPTNLGLSSVSQAPDFAKHYFAREWVLSTQVDASEHIHLVQLSHDQGTAYQIEPCLAKEIYDAYMRTSRSATVLLSNQDPFVELGNIFVLHTKDIRDRALEIGGHPEFNEDAPVNYAIDVPNPLDKLFDSELEALRLLHKFQRFTKRFIYFIVRAFNKKGHSVEDGNPKNHWNFHSITCLASGFLLNACVPGTALFFSLHTWHELRRAIGDSLSDLPSLVDDRSDEEIDDESNNPYSTTSSPVHPPISPVYQPDSPTYVPSTPEIVPSDTPHIPSNSPTPVPNVTQVPTPQLGAPIPTPVNYPQGPNIQEDLNRANEVSPAPVAGTSNANPDANPIDPLLAELRKASLVSASSRFTHARYEPLLGKRPFLPNCACQQRDSHLNAYIQGRIDEHNDILEDNHNHGFVALRDEDFLYLVNRVNGKFVNQSQASDSSISLDDEDLLHHLNESSAESSMEN